ncbi:hypothetical protein ACXHJ2_04875 [Paenibacillus sp. ALE3]|uniref:hypothetical protein n=1 Tax=Paenibacillus sp. EKM207P TaxID=1683675 RepID=UPI001EEA7914|nr:hypothetical protein [Paenibacillus sp. EKM207P]
MTYQEIQMISNMLSLLCNYIVEEAMNKNLLTEMFEKASAIESTPQLSEILPGYSLKHIESLKKEMNNILADAYLNSSGDGIFRAEILYSNPLLNIFMSTRVKLSL